MNTDDEEYIEVEKDFKYLADYEKALRALDQEFYDKAVEMVEEKGLSFDPTHVDPFEDKSMLL